MLGLETAYAVSRLGAGVRVYDRNDYPLSRQLDREGGLFLKKRLTDVGIDILAGALEDFKTEMEDACVIAAAGVKPSAGLAQQCGIQTSRGIVVDERMRTSATDVYACGDLRICRSSPGADGGRVAQGEAAGINAAGGSAFYRPILAPPRRPGSRDFMISVGSGPSGDGRRLYRKTDGENYAVRGGFFRKVAGAAFIGDIAPGLKMKKWMEAGGEAGAVSSFDESKKDLGRL